MKWSLFSAYVHGAPAEVDESFRGMALDLLPAGFPAEGAGNRWSSISRARRKRNGRDADVRPGIWNV